jgi:Fe-S oxidoreductase
MGLIHRWARLAHLAPGLVNALTRTPVLNRLIKAIAGIAEERTIPPFARTSFGDWFSSYRTKNPDGPPVLLFPDTFNNFFRPDTAIAATEVLERLGYEVTVPRRPLCCGRPLYDWGMLDTAKKLWSRILDQLEPQISAGVPVIGLEPACVAAFRDELVNLCPDDPRAQRLSQQTFLLSEFIDAHAEKFDLPKLHRKVLVQVHCHHHAIMTFAAARHVLDRMEVDYTLLPSGCCGMAGSFGFEADKVEISKKAAERVLLPAVRQAEPQTVILANGFSCREQIEQGTGRPTLHLAELIAAAAEPSFAG